MNDNSKPKMEPSSHQKHPELKTLRNNLGTPTGIVKALSKPSGSRFYRCAFQVNPFKCGEQHAKRNGFQNEAEYNDAMAKACVDRGIQVVAITDHFRFDDSLTFMVRLQREGIIVFPGFEANSSEGVHILCQFPPDTTASQVNALIAIPDPACCATGLGGGPAWFCRDR